MKITQSDLVVWRVARQKDPGLEERGFLTAGGSGMSGHLELAGDARVGLCCWASVGYIKV